MESAISSKDFEKPSTTRIRSSSSARTCVTFAEVQYQRDGQHGVVTKADIEDVVSRWTGVPVNSIKEEEMQRLSRIEEELHRRIVSQEQAINALARAIRRSRAGLKSPNRRRVPSCSSDRPASARRKWRDRLRVPLRQRKVFDPIRYVEFMEKHSVSKLIGSPPGYVGYEEGGHSRNA